MEKTNIAELLKGCPKGMELDCAMYDNVQFDFVQDGHAFPIKINTPEGIISLSKYGSYSLNPQCKCVIFPKGKTTWQGFKRPFEDGDVLCSSITNQPYILKFFDLLNDTTHSYCGIDAINIFCTGSDNWSYASKARFSTEDEKERLFKAIKDNGYKWNAETKTLEKIEPNFKVGDRIKRKGDTRLTTIKEIRDDCYIITFPDSFGNAYITDKLLFSKQDEYEIIPNKFDITTLKPFDRVLVRGDVGQKWTHDFFGFMDKDKGCPFVCVGHYVIQCIPYEGNEHLLGKTEDCNDFYKTWE